MTTGEYLARWLVEVKDKTGQATFERYQQLTEQYLILVLGKIRLSKLRPLHIETAYGNLSRGAG